MGKRRSLGKDSFLGKFGVNLREIDLGQLIGRQHLTILCKLSRNRYSIQTKALTDTRANGFAFIDTLYAVDIAKFLNLKAERLPNPITVRGYNGKAQNAITHYLRLYMTIDRQR